ncbi:MAG TPA: hypothetical protein VMZ28_02720 [Kofleriaceae bacterium]|nr:hypothetical protein [Kofleriaceae bacterium]
MRALLLAAAGILAGCSIQYDGDAFRGGDRESPAGDGDVSQPDRPGGPDASAASAPDAVPPVCGDTCGGGDCNLECPDLACACELDCAGTTGDCKIHCDHHDCAIDCSEVDKCEARCNSSDTTCAVDCSGARDCEHVKCEKGAACTLQCGDNEKCGFEECDGEELSCEGGLIACNAPCP